ncbi:MAG TPA: dTDP-Rha--alpha-D-GlcNAc-pyrophosphate polyprenol alpha-3-L-rhamnosyltransferase [Prolixibacteraceae bacterium]|jgi:GT2 family glycosyltransferase|nr:dTDP-Rha--alpha-D-GlcNAc-pyrophosphate polyprenol alpha-3-L-rhamnosyltransferase [Prolixibacteraceae bacterium]
MINPKIAIVILNWNGAKLMQQFLPSVIEFSRGDSTEIIVADNGSTDESLALLKDKFPQVTILDLEQNFGFARGYNEALKQIEADYYVILNSDVEVTAGWLESPIRLMEGDENIAAVQPKILSYYQRTHFEYAGAAGGFIDKYGYPFCRGRIFDEVEEDQGQYDTVTDVFWATGACIFVRNRVFHEVEGFDADFWAHMEEIDLCWRLKNRGYRIVYTPESSVYHVGGGTLEYNNPRKLYLNFRNNLWLLYKNLPGGQLFSILIVRMILDGIAATKLMGEFNFNGIKSVLKAHWHFYQSLPALKGKRKLVERDKQFIKPEGMLSKSIVFQYYIRKKKRFSEIEF